MGCQCQQGLVCLEAGACSLVSLPGPLECGRGLQIVVVLSLSLLLLLSTLWSWLWLWLWLGLWLWLWVLYIYIYIYIKAVLYYIAAIPVGFNNLCLCLHGLSWLVIAIRMFWTHLDSPGLTRTHLDPPGTHLELSQTHLESLGIIWTHLDSLGLTWIHLDSMTFGLTWAHLDSLVLTWSHLDSFGLTWIRVFKWYRLKPMHCHSSSIIPMLKPMHTSTNEQLDPYNDKSQWLKPMCTAATLLAGLTRRACCYSHRFQVLSHVSCCYLHVFLMGPLETNAKTMHSLFPSLKAWLWHITSHQ